MTVVLALVIALIVGYTIHYAWRDGGPRGSRLRQPNDELNSALYRADLRGQFTSAWYRTP